MPEHTHAGGTVIVIAIYVSYFLSQDISRVQFINHCLNRIVKNHYSIRISHQNALVEGTEKFKKIKLGKIEILVEEMCYCFVFHANRCLSMPVVFQTSIRNLAAPEHSRYKMAL